MGRVHNSLSPQHLILGTAISFGGALCTITLLTACSQPLASSTPNLKSSVPNPGAMSPVTSLTQKPLVTQRTNQVTPASETTLRSCRATDLKAVLNELQGAVGSRYGTIKFTNTTSTPCVLQGRPLIELLNSNQQLLPVRESATSAGDIGSKVTVQPGEYASLSFRWVNWCQKVPNNEIKFVVKLPGRQGQVPVVFPDAPEYRDTPPCNGPDSPSVLSVDLFKPSTASQGEKSGRPKGDT